MSFIAFLRDLRWIAPVSLALAVLAWAFEMRPLREASLLGVVGIWAVTLIVIGPAVWLRWRWPDRHGARAWKWLGLSLVWIAVSIGLIVAAASALGID